MTKKDIRKEKRKPGEIIPLNYNFMFAEIFNKKENISIVEYLLADFTGIPLSAIKGHVEILSRDLLVENKEDKNNEVDLLLDFNGLKINFEISRGMSEGVLQRNIVYVCNIHKSQLKYGDKKYQDIKATIQIQLNNFRCNDNEIKKTYFLRDENGKILSTNFQIDMVFGNEVWYTNKGDRLACWCRIMKVKTENDLEEVLGENFMDKKSKNKFVEEIKKYSANENNYALYTKLSRAELEHNTILAEIEEKRKQVDEKEKQVDEKIKQLEEQTKVANEKILLEVAKKLNSENIPIKLVTKITGLSKEKLQNIK